MTNEKAIDLLDTLLGMIEDNQGNDYDEAFKTGIKALEKQIPKKVVRKIVNRGFNLPMPTYVDVCPCCGIDTPNPRNLESWETWCPDCGQALDWSE